MTSRLRDRLKKMLPAGLRTYLRRAETYAARLVYWTRIAYAARGERPEDRRAVRSAFLRCPLTALSGIDHWQDPTLARDARIRIRGVGLFDVRAGADDLHHVLPGREPEVFDAIRTWLRPGDTFVDAGANIGFYTILASRIVGGEGRVVAIEMMPDTAAILRRHVAINDAGNVAVVEHALCETANLEIEARVDDGKFGQASIRRAEGGRVVHVRTETLDNLLDGVEHVRLMKMDLEGAEHLALAGARSVLRRTDALLFEALPGSEDVLPLLARHGFTVTSLNGRDHLAVKADKQASYEHS